MLQHLDVLEHSMDIYIYNNIWHLHSLSIELSAIWHLHSLSIKLSATASVAQW